MIYERIIYYDKLIFLIVEFLQKACKKNGTLNWVPLIIPKKNLLYRKSDLGHSLNGSIGEKVASGE